MRSVKLLFLAMIICAPVLLSSCGTSRNATGTEAPTRERNRNMDYIDEEYEYERE